MDNLLLWYLMQAHLLFQTLYRLINACVEKDIQVVALPGANAVTTALVASGLPTDKFLFLGFLPHKPGHRKKLLETVQKGELKKPLFF